MTNRRGGIVLALLLASAFGDAASAQSASTPSAQFSEVPSLAARVASGELPPVARRLPERPLVVETEPEAAYGGDLRMLIGTPKDWKLAFVYGYARLVRFDRHYQLVPDIAERVEVKDGGRSFTFHLRKGHRWSDGAPFTSADFAYWWEHVANDKDLSSGGPPAILLVDGEAPTVEFLDASTVRFRDVASLASGHHERLDGQGYYKGLTARDLTVPARLLTVADIFEALSANRPYRRGLPEAEVLEIMRRDVGTRVCPDCFDALRVFLDRTPFVPYSRRVPRQGP